MLALYLFIAFWVVLGLGMFLVAIGGGPSGVRASLQTQSFGPRRFLAGAFVITYAVFGVGLPLLFLTGNHAKANAQVGGLKLNAAERAGREIFGQRCGVCHTLSAANAIGKVGPNLDQVQPTEGLVLKTINNGCLQNAPAGSAETCLGLGTMPAGIIQGREAREVAAFVARVAGKE